MFYANEDNENPMSGVNAKLFASDGTIIDSSFTDNSGKYEFGNLASGTYIIKYSTEEEAGGIELSDAFLILQHISGNYTFDAIQAMAADVDGDGEIGMDDYNQIVFEYLNEENPFPVGPWVFKNDTVTFTTESLDGGGHLGSSSGDVNGSLQPDPKRNRLFVENPAIEIIEQESETIDFPLSCDDNLQIAGMHLSFRIPNELNVVGVESSIPGVQTFYKDGLLKVTWMDTTLQGYTLTNDKAMVTITTKTKNITVNGNNYNVVLCDESHLMDVNGNLISGVKLSLPSINVKLSQDLSVKAYPNPFAANVTIEYYMPQGGAVSIILTDQSGRIVADIENTYRNEGIQEETIDGTSLLPGIYYYTVRSMANTERIIHGTIIKSK